MDETKQLWCEGRCNPEFAAVVGPAEAWCQRHGPPAPVALTDRMRELRYRPHRWVRREYRETQTMLGRGQMVAVWGCAVCGGERTYGT